jgi:hypothetical protein
MGDASNPWGVGDDQPAKPAICLPDRSREAQERLRSVLADAADKLRRYRAHHVGEYVGGVEYHDLMKQIDEVLKETA